MWQSGRTDRCGQVGGKIGQRWQNLGFAFLFAFLSLLPAGKGYAGVWKIFTEGAWYYENDDGSVLMNGYTPDGYYVDNTGLWYANREVMGYIIRSRGNFMKASESENFQPYVTPLTNLQAILNRNLLGTRQLVLYTNRITVYSVESTNTNGSNNGITYVYPNGSTTTSPNNNTNTTNNTTNNTNTTSSTNGRPTAPSSQPQPTTVPSANSNGTIARIDTSNAKLEDVMTWYRNDDIDGYTLELKTSLSDVTRLSLYANTVAPQTYSWYDYQSLRMITNCTSSTGDALADAIYQSWTGKNSYGLRYGQWVQVGDSLVRFNPVTGIGRYDIKAA